MLIYNLFPLLAGRMSQWDEHFRRAAAMHFEWVFINPIQKLGKSGSLYSIADYFQFNPAFLEPNGPLSPDDQVRQMTTRAREAGLKPMLDLVLNHCAMDSPLVREHPDWFVREPDGRVAKSFCFHQGKKVVWNDLAKFDHQHSKDADGLFRFCLQVVERLAGLGFEGFRCDAAYQVPAQFWKRLIREIKAKHPHTCFIAETLGCTPEQTRSTARAGFSYIFNSSKWWNFNDWWLIEQYNLIRETVPTISFPESHDTPRLAEELNGNVEGLKQHYLFSALWSAGVMMPMGFEYGMRKPLHVVKTTPADWQRDGIDLCGYIAKVNEIKRSHPVFTAENPTGLLHTNNPNILLMWKASHRPAGEALLILNKDILHHQDFYTDHFRHFVQSGAPLKDVSPEYPLDYIHEPFHYGLRPGQGIVLVTARG